VEQELALESGRGELVPRDQEGRPLGIDNSGSRDPDELEEVIVGRQPELEARRPNPQIEERPGVS